MSLVALSLELFTVKFFKLILDFFDNTEKLTFNEWFVGLTFVILKLLTVILRRHIEFNKFKIHIESQISINSLLFNKTIKVSPSPETEKLSEGEVISLSQLDCIKIGWAFWHIPNIFGIPIQMIFLIIMLYDVVGLATLTTVATFCILFFLMFILLKIYFVNYTEFSKCRDKRIKLTSETLNGLKNLKLNGWDEEFLRNIIDSRIEESEYMGKNLSNVNWRFFMAWAALPLMMATTVGTQILLHGEIEMNVLLTMLMIIDQIKSCLEWLPVAVSLFIEAIVGFRRIEKYMQSTEVDPSYKQALEDNLAINIQDGTFSWGYNIKNRQLSNSDDSSDEYLNSFQIVLNKIDLSIQKGKLVAIIGEIGAGKSSLLNACMNNLLIHSNGSVKVDGTMAYVPQNSWIQNKTLRENILFHNEYNQERYEEVLRVCELNKDIEQFECGDLVEIGEKGINLSGGQKTRVAMARAVYQNADIILMDDPVSALDANVGKKVMKDCIVKFLSGKTRLLVTHAMQHLKYCDEIIYIVNGSIAWKGNYLNLTTQEFFKNMFGSLKKESIISIEKNLKEKPIRSEENK